MYNSIMNLRNIQEGRGEESMLRNPVKGCGVRNTNSCMAKRIHCLCNIVVNLETHTGAQELIARSALYGAVKLPVQGNFSYY